MVDVGLERAELLQRPLGLPVAQRLTHRLTAGRLIAFVDGAADQGDHLGGQGDGQALDSGQRSLLRLRIVLDHTCDARLIAKAQGDLLNSQRHPCKLVTWGLQRMPSCMRCRPRVWMVTGNMNGEPSLRAFRLPRPQAIWKFRSGLRDKPRPARPQYRHIGAGLASAACRRQKVPIRPRTGKG